VAAERALQSSEGSEEGEGEKWGCKNLLTGWKRGKELWELDEEKDTLWVKEKGLLFSRADLKLRVGVIRSRWGKVVEELEASAREGKPFFLQPEGGPGGAGRGLPRAVGGQTRLGDGEAVVAGPRGGGPSAAFVVPGRAKDP